MNHSVQTKHQTYSCGSLAHRWQTCLVIAALALGLSGCGGGASTSENPQSNSGTTTNVIQYSGPPPASDNIQAFKLNVWDNLNSTNRCGSCHAAGGQTPQFVRLDDINQAYAAANTVVDLVQPSSSRMVTKVAGGHNCWLQSDAACASVITAYIAAWAGSTEGAAGRQINLVAPSIFTPGDSRSFPADPSLFSTTVHPVLTQYCANCHRDSSSVAQSPFFANVDAASSYEAAKSKIDLETPANSRFVLRLRQEFHNCWSNCADDANTMQAAIEAFQAGTPVTQIDPSFVLSRALRLVDGTLASGGNRHEVNAIALYEFKEGSGTVAADTSGVAPEIPLNLIGQVDWVGGYGIDIINGKAQGSTANSKKLADQIRASGEYSVEAWVIPSNVVQEGPARIISYSAGTQARNFTLGQTKYNYDFLQRSSTTSANGEPGLSTADADERLQATQQHVTVTFDPVNGRKIYVNGQFTGDMDNTAGGNLSDWDDTYALVLGNEVSGDRLWQGKLRLVAIHNRALTEAQIQQNFEAGVGQKFFLLFRVGDIIRPVPPGMTPEECQILHANYDAQQCPPEFYILLETAQFDNYSYLFANPKFIDMDSDEDPTGIQLQGMRIGINGRQAVSGQAFANLDVVVDSASMTDGVQELSNIGTIVPLENGPGNDMFFLTFERFGTATNAFTEPTAQQPAPPSDSTASDIGLRTFDEINISMANMTTVSANNSQVVATFNTIKQQLPTTETIEAFQSAYQVAVSQLAIEYCNALVASTSLRSAYFPGFVFGSDATVDFNNQTKRDQIINPLLANMYGSGLTVQPDPAAVTTELNSLIARLTTCGGGCPADRTETVVKATCAATLGSAAMLLQ